MQLEKYTSHHSEYCRATDRSIFSTSAGHCGIPTITRETSGVMIIESLHNQLCHVQLDLDTRKCCFGALPHPVQLLGQVSEQHVSHSAADNVVRGVPSNCVEECHLQRRCITFNPMNADVCLPSRGMWGMSVSLRYNAP